MSRSIRETGLLRSRQAAISVGAASVLGTAAIAAAVYAPASADPASVTSGTSQDSSGNQTFQQAPGSTRGFGAQQYQQSQRYQQGLQSSQGGGAMGHSSGS